MERATVRVYDDHSRDWAARREPYDLDRARAFAARVTPGAVRVDVGCGPGFHVDDLGTPVVAIDAVPGMLEQVAERAPHAALVCADLEALPFRDRSLGGAWAAKSYLHVPRVRLPLALARLHWALVAGAPVELIVLAGTGEGQRTDDDFPGRYFTEWEPDPFVDVLVGAGFVVDDLDADETIGDRTPRSASTARWIRVQARRERTLPDTVGPGMRLLVCGLNPSLYAADRGVGFARPNNRYWNAARTAGLVAVDRDPLDALVHHGVGMTDLVKRATAAAAELTTEEYRSGVARVERLVRWLQPGAVCFVGLAGWRAAIDRKAEAGVQPDGFGGRPAYVMPSTSGLNARVRPAELVEHLRAALALGG
jgi:double-stranded uracil-DNA glycosylase